MKELQLLLTGLFAWSIQFCTGQGGTEAYAFAKISPVPVLTARGGSQLAGFNAEGGAYWYNQALAGLNDYTSAVLSFNTGTSGNRFFAGYQQPIKSNWVVGGTLQYNRYAVQQFTTDQGVEIGSFSPSEYKAGITLAAPYKERWFGGIALNVLSAKYGSYGSTALAMDAGILYLDTSNGLSIGVSARNIGTQLKSFAGNEEDLPLELSIGVAKKLAQSPFTFYLNILQIHKGNLLLTDRLNTNGQISDISGGEQLLAHTTVGADITLLPKLQLSIGYNFLNRYIGTLQGGTTGISGVTMGAYLKLKTWQLHAAYGGNNSIQSPLSFSVSLDLNRLTGL